MVRPLYVQVMPLGTKATLQAGFNQDAIDHPEIMVERGLSRGIANTKHCLAIYPLSAIPAQTPSNRTRGASGCKSTVRPFMVKAPGVRSYWRLVNSRRQGRTNLRRDTYRFEQYSP